jgi:putative phosphoribosyl transferase
MPKFFAGIVKSTALRQGTTLAQTSFGSMSHTVVKELPVQIPAGRQTIVDADLGHPDDATGLIVFAHGSGSSRFSQRNRAVAHALHEHRLTTLLVDLLTRDEERVDATTREFRFDIDLLGRRVIAAIDWSANEDRIRALPIACFGASTGAAAALIAAADRPDVVRAVVSRGGRPDLAGEALRRVTAPTLLLVGGDDEPVIQLNRQAMAAMTARVELVIIPGATHLFEEPGTLEQVTTATIDWCRLHLVDQTTRR